MGEAAKLTAFGARWTRQLLERYSAYAKGHTLGVASDPSSLVGLVANISKVSERVGLILGHYGDHGG